MFGCLFTGFYVLREYNQTVGTLIPVVIDLLVAALALALPARTPAQVAAADSKSLREVGFESAAGIFRNYAGRPSAWAAGSATPRSPTTTI